MSVTPGSDRAGDPPAEQRWRAAWCWPTAHSPRPWNAYAYFRLAVNLPGKPTAAVVRVSADARYTLYANGRRVHQGPARCWPDRQTFDELDLADVLAGGPNVICAVVHQVGVPTAQSAFRDASGFLLDGSAEIDGEMVDLSTPGRWVCRQAKGWRKNVERATPDLGFQEHFDADADPAEWTAAEYTAPESDGWRAPVVVAPAEGYPWVTMTPRRVPLLADKVTSFREVVSEFTGENARGHKVAEDVYKLLAQETRKRAKTPIENADALLRDDGQGVAIPPPGDGQFYAMVLDLGRVRLGHIILDILEAAGDEIVDIVYTTRLDKAQGAAIDEEAGGAADRYRCRPGVQRWEPFAAKGFRYATLVFRNVEKPLRVRYVGVRSVGAAVEQVGTFGCGDAVLTAVYRAAAGTLKTCMADAYLDCPERGQAQRWPDVRTQFRAGAACFTDTLLVERAILLAAESQAADGSLHTCAPADAPSARRIDGMLDWVATLHDYHAQTGRTELLARVRPALERLLSLFAGHERVDGLVGGFERFTVGLPPTAGVRAVDNLQYLRALRCAAGVYRALGDGSASAEVDERAGRVASAIEKHFWDEKAKSWRDAVGPDGAAIDGLSVHANALAVDLGLQADQRETVAREAVLRGMTARRGKLTAAPPALGADVLGALVTAGLRAEAVELIKTKWGPMVEGAGEDDASAATLWEQWDGAEGSRCFGAGCAPILTLVEVVLGVTRVEPGWGRVRIAPLVGEMEFARGSVPTPLGLIRVEWEKVGDDQLAVRVELPEGMAGEFVGPLGVTRALEAGASEFQA